jgi:hypothetical protein
MLRTSGKTAPEILLAARTTLRTQRRGLILLHWPDADRAGHDHGWMSDEYAEGCVRLDDALGMLTAVVDVAHDPQTILIALADHGGGGTNVKDHESDHALDRTIPLVIGRDIVATAGRAYAGRCSREYRVGAWPRGAGEKGASWVKYRHFAAGECRGVEDDVAIGSMFPPP